MKERICFSAINNAFYVESMRANYEASGNWPEDARLISFELYEEFINPPEGKERIVIEGEPSWADIQKPSLNVAQKIAISRTETFAVECRRAVAGNPDHLETAEWSEKRLRAIRVVEKQPLPGDIEKLEIEARHRNRSETVEQLALIIKAKADRFENASIVITGMTSAAILAINEAKTVEDIEKLYVSLTESAEKELAKLV